LSHHNTQNSVVEIALWDNGDWRPAVDVIDFTEVSGKSLNQNGYIRFLRDIDRAWPRVHESFEISELAGTVIYDMYWMRIKFDADLSTNTAIKFIGNKFSADAALYSQYPDLNQPALLTLYATGKENWDEQHFIAANCIVNDLKQRKMIISQDQVLDPWAFELVSVHKVAEVIYGGLGDAYQNNKKAAHEAYQMTFNESVKSFNLDVSADGTLSRGEQIVTFGTRYR
jgi:hypothetical protein